MRVAFFTHDEWALGSLYTSLSRRIRQHGIIADVVSHNANASLKEINFMRNTYDVWSGLPCSLNRLHQEWGIEEYKMVVTLHSPWDHREGSIDFNNVRGFTTINTQYNDTLKKEGVKRVPTLTRCGVDFDYFYSQPRDSLVTCGYAGSKYGGAAGDNQGKWKRSHLYKQILNKTNLREVKKPRFIPYRCMPGFYRNCDSVFITSSNMEAGGLPIMESAASGALTCAANIGVNKVLGKTGGVLLPYTEEAYVKTACDVVEFFQKYPDEYNKRCKINQEFAREYYDWDYVIQDWIEALTGGS